MPHDFLADFLTKKCKTQFLEYKWSIFLLRKKSEPKKCKKTRKYKAMDRRPQYEFFGILIPSSTKNQLSIRCVTVYFQMLVTFFR